MSPPSGGRVADPFQEPLQRFFLLSVDSNLSTANQFILILLNLSVSCAACAIVPWVGAICNNLSAYQQGTPVV